MALYAVTNSDSLFQLATLPTLEHAKIMVSDNFRGYKDCPPLLTFQPQNPAAPAKTTSSELAMTSTQRKTVQRQFLSATFKKIVVAALALAGIALILWFDSHFMQHAEMPQLSRDASYGLLLLVGFLTSFHCVGMCGPLVVGYVTSRQLRGSSPMSPIFYTVPEKRCPTR